MFTTNVEFSHWDAVFANNELATATVGRIVHHDRTVEFGGPSH